MAKEQDFILQTFSKLLNLPKESKKIPTYANQVYAFEEKLILKIFDSEEEWENSLIVSNLFRQHNIITPLVRAKGKNPRPYILMDLLDGHPISEEPTLKAHKNFGECVGKLHQVKFKQFGGIQNAGVGIYYKTKSGPFNNWKDMHISLVEHRMRGFDSTILQPLVSDVCSYFGSYSYPTFHPTLVHEDLHAKNVFVKNGIITGLIDLGEGYSGCEEEDLMRIEIAQYEEHPNLRESFLEGYMKCNSLLPNYEDRRPHFRLSRLLVEADCVINLSTYKVKDKKLALQTVYDEISSILIND